MRILILFSSFLASTINPLAVVKKNTTPAEVSSPAPLVVEKSSGTQTLDIDTEYLMKGGWKILSITADKPCDVNGDGYETTDVMSETPACALDDVMKIYPDHTVSFERRQRCVSSEKPLETYKWKLASDGTFTVIDGSIESKMVLKSVNDSRLVMLIPMEEGGEIYNFKVTYGQTTRSIPGKILKN